MDENKPTRYMSDGITSVAGIDVVTVQNWQKRRDELAEKCWEKFHNSPRPNMHFKTIYGKGYDQCRADMEAELAKQKEFRLAMQRVMDEDTAENAQLHENLVKIHAERDELKAELSAYKDQSPEDYLTPYENELLGDKTLLEKRLQKQVDHIEKLHIERDRLLEVVKVAYVALNKIGMGDPTYDSRRGIEHEKLAMKARPALETAVPTLRETK